MHRDDREAFCLRDIDRGFEILTRPDNLIGGALGAGRVWHRNELTGEQTAAAAGGPCAEQKPGSFKVVARKKMRQRFGVQRASERQRVVRNHWPASLSHSEGRLDHLVRYHCNRAGL